MATMRDAVLTRAAQLEHMHARWKTRKHGWLVRPATIALGALVVIIGIIAIPLPGQGWLITFAGISILALEVAWARRLLTWGLATFDRVSTWYRAQPRWLRWLIMTLFTLITIATLALVAWASWFYGGLDWLSPAFEFLGLERRR
ncbi:TIGR02611 family protein [Corynebacterium tapiri]|uniref:TIGR02611 family protein n=1 Tax=Corynebacterium tapiri TaxID=1448266 RepID=A0A5C4U6E2_9CORY|nr:TIGR02611 family protein [Corynebacterium tapiri]TNL98524.1 TIGR02611 family protein [Corynebacterium tapiri]